MLNGSPDDLHAREVLLSVLNALNADDRDVVCDYVFKNEPDRGNLEFCSTVRYQAVRLVDLLAGAIRFDSSVDPGFFTQHLHDEARDWIAWAGGFSIAQEEVEKSYAKIRSCERWAQAPPWGNAIVRDDRPILADLCEVLERNIRDLETTPTPGASRPIPPELPRTTCRALAVVYYTIIQWFTLKRAMGDHAGVVDWHWSFCRTIAAFAGLLAGAIGGSLYTWFCSKRGARSPAALMEQNIQSMRVRARQWVLLWKALLALAQDMLACENPDEGRLRHLLRIFDCVDKRFKHTLWDARPLFDSIDRSLVCRTDSDALGEAVAARFFSIVKHRVEVHGSVLDISNTTSDNSAGPDAQRRLQLDLNNILEAACTDLGIVDPLFKLIAIGHYVHKSGAARQGHACYCPGYPRALVNAIPNAVDALQFLTMCTGLLDGAMHNMHARLAWIGGLGRAQKDIVAQIALFRQDPRAEQVQRLSDTLEYHLNALLSAPVASFRDLSKLTVGTGKKRIILIEILKTAYFLPACFLLAIFPQMMHSYLDHIFLFICAFSVETLTTAMGRPALVGLYNYVFVHCDSTSLQSAHTAAAQLEHYARYHLVGWAALLRLLKSDFNPDIVERVAAVKEALFENISASASAHPISKALDKRLDRPRFADEVDFCRSCARAVRDLMDKHYPHFRGAVQKCGNKRARAGNLGILDGENVLASQGEDAGAPPRYRDWSERFQNAESSG